MMGGGGGGDCTPDGPGCLQGSAQGRCCFGPVWPARKRKGAPSRGDACTGLCARGRGQGGRRSSLAERWGTFLDQGQHFFRVADLARRHELHVPRVVGVLLLLPTLGRHCDAGALRRQGTVPVSGAAASAVWSFGGRYEGDRLRARARAAPAPSLRPWLALPVTPTKTRAVPVAVSHLWVQQFTFSVGFALKRENSFCRA